MQKSRAAVASAFLIGDDFHSRLRFNLLRAALKNDVRFVRIAKNCRSAGSALTNGKLWIGRRNCSTIAMLAAAGNRRIGSKNYDGTVGLEA